MASYLIQVAYTPDAWGKLVSNPQDRTVAIQPAIERLGGRLISAYGCFGEYDTVVIVEMPDNVSAAALSVAFAAGGALKACKTTPLLSTTELQTVMRKAADTGYKPPA